MSVKYALLGILAEKEHHGYELKCRFDERVGDFWSLNYGQIYTTLDRLEREGLVEWRGEAQPHRPDRKVYRITPKGRRELEEWLSRPVGKTRPLRDELFVKLVFMDRSRPEALLELIAGQKEIYMRRMSALTKRKVELGRRVEKGELLVTDLLIDAALFHAEADLRWLAHCEAKATEAAVRT